MTDEGPRSCSPNEFAALIIYLNAPKPVEGEGVMLAPCFLLTPCLLSLVMSLVWQSPRRYPGHTSTWHAPAAWSPCPWVSPAHASAAASWWLWTPYYWAPRSLEYRRVEEKIEGQQPVERWWNNSHGISKTFFFFPIDDFRLSESDSYVPSQSNRANTTSHTWSDSSTLATVRATCFMVTERRREGSTDREIHHLSDGEIEVQVTQSSS